MEYRNLGKWGLPISAVSVGGHVDWGKSIPDEQTEEILVTAYEGGVNYFDSAEKYAEGRCEELIAQTIFKQGWRRETLILGTKISVKGLTGAAPTERGMHRKHIVETVERSLRRYRTDHLDLLFCHRPDPSVPAAEVVTTMNRLVQQGKVLYWGTSDHSATLLMEMHGIADRRGMEGPQMEQTWYNLIGRARIEDELLPLFERFGMGITAYQPLCGGILTGKYQDGIPKGSRLDRVEWARAGLTQQRLEKVRQFKQVADDLGMSLATMAIAWTLKNPNISTCIAGASRPEHIRSNLGAVEAVARLDDGAMARIAEIQGEQLQI
jgi:voltage-dependent potassium channel beta subunit